VVLLFLIVLASIANAETLYWFSTSSPASPSDFTDFRGCYGTRCVYVASSPVNSVDSRIGKYYEDDALWAVLNNPAVDPVFLLSVERPPEVAATEWISPVAHHTFVPSEFDPTPYLAKEADPIIAKFVADVSEAHIREHVDFLATAFFTRNSLSTDAVQASEFLANRLADLGCQKVTRTVFLPNYAPNVICELPGTDPTSPGVVVGAHYDSRSTGVSNPTQRAPGADDNGTGSASVIEILNLFAKAIGQVSFKKTITFALFAGEEQGLRGSAALAADMRRAGTALSGMVNLDMIGYPQPNAPATLYWMSGSTNRPLTDLAISLTKTYLGESTVLAYTGACCSDQQSFHAQGYPAASIFESLSAGNNPNYHQSSDLPSTVTFSHVVRNCKSALALIATLAEPTATN